MDVVNVRTHPRVAEDLPHLQIQVFTGQTGMLLAVDDPWERDTDENSPVPGSTLVQERSVAFRSSPRQPLQDLTHLYYSNGLSRNRNTRNAGMAKRVRRRSLESPVPSKKRRLSEGTSPFTEGLSMPASKSPRTSTGLRSFR
ncbi:hypothetical protein R1sor_004097 [Riccia sorocarpa]|uniref:Uncharacterized protein n=1 Tax=Riccia sorocarpa TaxID=122646 RepID=A0ABD3H721_9MARC